MHARVLRYLDEVVRRGSIRKAAEYLQLAAEILGEEWICARTFRFGASSLLASLLETLGHGAAPKANGGY